MNTGFKTNIALRALKLGDKYYFYAVNPGYWPLSGTIELSEKTDFTEVATGKKSDAVRTVKFSLEPFGIAAWQANSGSVKITGWKNNPVPDTELAHMRNIITKAKNLLKLSGIEKYLGKEDFLLLKNSTKKAEQAINAGRYAEAWITITNAFYWGTLFEKGKGAKYAGNVGPRTLEATEAAEAPVIDGKLDDAVWNKSIGQTRFVNGDKQVSKLNTWVYTAWKGSKLYLAFKCEDPDIGKLRTTAKTEMDLVRNKDDSIDFTVDPPGKHYYQFAFNTKGVKFDQKCLSATAKDYDYAPDWNVKAVVTPNGWTAEVEIATEKAFGYKISQGKEWKMNFHRIFRNNDQPPSSWVWTPGFHSMDHMGIVRFAGINLLANPSAEILKNNWPDNWSWSGGIGKNFFTCIPTDKEKHSGKYSVMLKFNGFRGKRPRMGAYVIAGGQKRRPELSLTPGKSYTMSFWMKTNITLAGVYLITSDSNGKTKVVATKIRVKQPKPGWNYHSGTFDVPENVKFVAPAFSMHGAEKPMPKPWSGLPLINDKTVMYIDDVMISKE